MKSLVLVLLLCIGLPATPARAQFPIVKDYSNEWLVFYESQQLYIPYFEEVHKDVNLIHLYVDVSKYKKCYLRLTDVKDSYIFLNNSLYKALGEEEYFMKISDLLPYTSNGRLFLSLFKKGVGAKVPGVGVEEQVVTRLVKTEVKEEMPVYKQERSPVRDVYVLLALAFLFITALYNRYVFNALSAQGLSKLLNLFSIRNTYDVKLTNQGVSSFVLYFIGVMAFLSTFFSQQTAHWQSSEGGSLGSVFSLLFSTFLVVCLYVASKFSLILLLNKLAKREELAIIHIHDFTILATYYLQLWLLFSCFLIFGMYSIETSTLIFVSNVFVYSQLIIVATLWYRIFSTSSFKNVYLFSYLCSTEVIPISLLVKQFLLSY